VERELAGRHAVVTGAARGVGQQVAVRLAAAGATVSILDVLDQTATAHAIEAAGGHARAFEVDVSDRSAVHGAVDAAASAEGSVDLVTTAAGVYGEVTSIDDLDEAELDRVLQVNLHGTVWTLQAALPHLRRQGGRIVCIGSVAGKVGGVLAGPHYAATKGAVHTLVRWLARAEARHGIAVNGVAPGVIDTAMIAGKGYQRDYCPMGRFAEPGEIADVVRFLSTSASSYMTGAVLDVNGGYYLS
jgi:3-oxoacyl-[acyl-carrier protein] reductase